MDCMAESLPSSDMPGISDIGLLCWAQTSEETRSVIAANACLVIKSLVMVNTEGTSLFSQEKTVTDDYCRTVRGLATVGIVRLHRPAFSTQDDSAQNDRHFRRLLELYLRQARGRQQLLLRIRCRSGYSRAHRFRGTRFRQA